MAEYKMVRLGDVCEIQSGGTPSRSKTEYWKDGTIPWVKIGDFSGKYLDKTTEHITQQGLDNSSAKLFSKGTILYSIFATLGEATILNIDATTNQAIAGIKIKDKSSVDIDYFYSFLKSLKDEVNRIGRGVAQNNINLSILKSFFIPLPPLETQKQIAAQLDKCTAVIAKHKQMLEKYATLIKSRFIEMFGDPVQNPMGWEVRKLKETTDIITGNTPSRKDKENYGAFIEWIKTDNITDKTYVTTAAEYLSEKGEMLGRTVEAGSILMACIAGSLRSIGRVALTDRKVAFNQQINAIVPKKYNSLFLYVLFQNTQSYVQSTVNMALKGILSKGKLEELEYIIPPIELQNDFAAFVQQIDKSKFAVQKSLEKAETLYKSLMQRYFA